jgi:hypothetical protein
MKDSFFAREITGNWITQSTYYFLINSQNKRLKTITNHVKWRDISQDQKFINFIEFTLQKEKQFTIISLYKTELISNLSSRQIYYMAFVRQISNEIQLLKFNEAFDLIKTSTVIDYSDNHLSLISQIKSFVIIEKIYILNKNVKVIKSVVKKNNQCIATSFSSEIKIS